MGTKLFKMNKLLLFLLILSLGSCKEKYTSPIPPVATGYLVIEGVVNDQGGQTNIRLSRTASLTDTSKLLEQGANVLLSDSLGTSYQLYESAAGIYSIANLYLNPSIGYRISINTGNGEIYQSDFVRPVNNPAIDSIDWVRNNDGVQLFINTHDPANNTHYFQWDFNETWEFHSPFQAQLKWTVVTGSDGNQIWGVDYRNSSDPQISICWQSDASNTINLGSSLKLSQDIIHLPLVQIPNDSWKLGVLYSILVKQYAWTSEGYDFLSRMKKNTESVGSVFDAQPSELNTNFHCISKPGQPVIGFFNICTVQQKRIFIKNTDLTNWNYRTGCKQVTIVNNPDSIKTAQIEALPIGVSQFTPTGKIAAMSASTPTCVDCTLTGTNIKPDFWP